MQNTIRENNSYTCRFWIKNFSLGNGSLAGDIAHYVEAKLWKIVFLIVFDMFLGEKKSRVLGAPTMCQALYYTLSHFLSFFEAGTIISFLQIQERTQGC